MSEQPKYGLQATSNEDGVERVMSINEFEDGRYGIWLKTKWPDQSDPVVTMFSVSKAGLSMLSQLIDQVHNIRNFPLLEESK